MPNGEYTLESTVAYEPDGNLSTEMYSKQVKVDANTIEVKVMPDGALYWYGYEGDGCEELSSANGWTPDSGYSFQTPTYNTQDAVLNAGSSKYSGIGANRASKGKTNAIVTGITANSNIYGYLRTMTTKTTDDTRVSQVLKNTSPIEKLSINKDDSLYSYAGAANSRSIRLHALWTSKPNPLANFFSAAKDTVYYLDNGIQVAVAETDEFGGAKVDFSQIPNGVTLYSSVAKDPTDATLQTAFSKQFIPSGNKFYLMPDNALYWYGNNLGELEQTHASASNSKWTFNDTNVYGYSPDGNCILANKNVISVKDYTTLKVIADISGNVNVETMNDKTTMSGYAERTTNTPTGLGVKTLSITSASNSAKYVGVVVNTSSSMGAASCTLYAMWLE